MPAGVIKYIEGQRQFEIHFPRERVVIKVGYIGSDPTLLARPYQKEDGNRGTVVDAKEFPTLLIKGAREVIANARNRTLFDRFTTLVELAIIAQAFQSVNS